MASLKKIREKAVNALSDRHNQIALAIFLFALALRLNYAFMSGMWADEGRYANIGRALLAHPFEYSSRMDGIVKAFPPVFPYMLFISQAIFGAGDFAVRIINPVLGSLSVLLIYALGRVMFSKNAGLFAAALLSVSPIAWFYDERILLETPMNFFSLLTILAFYYGYERKHDKILYASGAFFVLAYLTKQSTFFVLPAIAAYLAYSRKAAWLRERRIWMAALFALLLMVPWAARSIGACGSVSCESTHALTWFKTEGGDKLDVVYDYFYYVKLTPYLLSASVLVLFFFGLIPLANGKNKKENVLLLSLAAMIYFIFAITSVKDLRYVLPAVPPILLIAAGGVDEISRQLAGKQIKYSPLIAALILVPVLYWSHGSGKELILNKAPGFLMLREAGQYFEKMPADTIIMGTSSQAISFYGGDKKMVAIPAKQEDFDDRLYNTSAGYLELDAYERTLPSWVWGYAPGQPYLALEKVFYQGGQPVVGIFRVDREKLFEAIRNSTKG